MNGYHLITFNNDIKEQFFNFCKDASLQKDPAAVNMWADDWNICTHTLPYILINTSRYSPPNGEFFIVLNNAEIIGCSGVYLSDFSSTIALAGSRTWIAARHRNKSLLRELLLPAHKQWAKDHFASAVGLTFNDYNKNLINTWKRIRLGENRTPRQSHHLFYNNFNEIQFPLNIQHTKQWAIYEKLDNNYDFDWTTIEYR